ncbi:MAG: hypothetical protein JWQ38_1380 [Flavipsychrobacter sp.]|nr:hypothetical protein [Flavipsychrobacter sp.]
MVKTPPFRLGTFAYFRRMKYLILFITILVSYSATAQPKWQQHVDTKIDVRLDDRKHVLDAYEELTYTNNSPDTLKFIYMHLWPNAYKNDHTPMARQMDLNGSKAFYYAKPKDRGYIDSLQFTVDGHSAEYYSSENAPDIARIDLQKPLLPGKSIKITTPFKVKLPKVFSRMGHTGQAYYISQWFPKPAVYDTKGWHPISYQDQGEFFSEYGSYDVNITLPTNYVLMATGNCMDVKENARMDELAKKEVPKDSLGYDPTPASDLEMKTVHYHEDNIHDFAWFADKRWVVRKDTVYSPGNGQLVTTWSAFMPSYQKEWLKANGYLKETVLHYGKWIGQYQYKTIKAVLGDLRAGGGMEYPTITVIDKSDRSSLKTVVIHEAGHNWFYGMLGSNERDHAWMDEGLNTFYEQKTTRDLNHDTLGKKKGALNETLLYYQNVATHIDQAIDETSSNFTKLNYGLDVYYKSALVLRWLEQYMGPENFEAGMKEYYDKWHYHHPYPEDFRVIMERHATKPVGWFFDTILNTTKRIDFTIVKAKVNGNKTEMTIRNNTGVSSPVLIDVYTKDSITNTVWTPPFAHTAHITVPGSEWSRMKIDNDVPDGKSANDVYRRHALFHHFGVKLNPFAGLNRAEKDKVFLSLAWGRNRYDGFMLGILLHNLTIPENRFRFAVAPLYGFNSGAVNGAGSVGYVWYPENIFKEVMLQADGKTFHNNKTSRNLPSAIYGSYTKVAPSLSFTFNEHNPLSTVSRTLTLKAYNITENNIDTSTVAGITGPIIPKLKTESNMYGLVRYLHKNERTYNPFDYSAEGQMGKDFAKVNVEGNLRIDYNTKNKALYVRGYLGKFFPITNTVATNTKYELNASYSGVNDYLYDGTYYDRNGLNGKESQQVSIQEGGFKVPVFNNAARSDNWMATINLKTDLPLGKLPIRLFFDAGLIPNAAPSITNTSQTTLLYDGGVEVWLVKDIVAVYAPLIMSNDFQNYIVNTFGRKNMFVRSLSFTVQLQNINWLKTPSRLLKSATN